MNVTYMGQLYKISKRNLKQFLTDRAALNDKGFESYAKDMGPLLDPTGPLLDLTDLQHNEAANMLKRGIR